MNRQQEILWAVEQAKLPELKDADAEGRAGTVLIEIFGYKAFCQFPEALMDSLVLAVGRELELVARHGFNTMPIAEDCNDMSVDQRDAALPGLIRWQHLKRAQEV